MIARHVETIFCDDIRHEIGGKISYIGVYAGTLFVPEFPATLSKLCLSVKVVAPGDEPLRSLSLRILKNEDTLQDIAVGEEQLADAYGSRDDTADGSGTTSVRVAQFMVVFSPILFDEPCTLRVQATTESGVLIGVALKVGAQPKPASVP